MKFLLAFIVFVVIVGIALLLGWTRKTDHPAVHFYTWLGAITVLLLLRWCL